MCQICLLIDKSLPSPRTIARARQEVQITNEHYIEIVNKIMKDFSPNEAEQYVNLVTEELFNMEEPKENK